MQAKDIPDELFLQAVRTTGIGRPLNWSSTWLLQPELERLMGTQVPFKVMLAKAHRLIKKGVMNGCACGCRGDFTVE